MISALLLLVAVTGMAQEKRGWSITLRVGLNVARLSWILCGFILLHVVSACHPPCHLYMLSDNEKVLTLALDERALLRIRECYGQVYVVFRNNGSEALNVNADSLCCFFEPEQTVEFIHQGDSLGRLNPGGVLIFKSKSTVNADRLVMIPSAVLKDGDGKNVLSNEVAVDFKEFSPLIKKIDRQLWEGELEWNEYMEKVKQSK